ncbi:hypothetical protein BV25DRAFT_1826641 [Artomyces pyxidatus]|uniref:Uncharacterized protein n=1 Tax=Artomyces pyxidatus TaxID=48021 RepID=A0ACB8T0B3_9AGAM|nr:hypothetical protein BV25DRAFT_1826641 [Artomyces pyxidatus]
MQEERTSAELALHAVDLRIHALSPGHVSRLSAETLRCVFLHHFSIRDDVSWVRPAEREPVGWMRVTHVCRRWRDVALGNPLLWSHIVLPLTSPEWARAILAREQHVPVTVSWVGIGYAKTPALSERRVLPLTDLAGVERLKLGEFDGRMDVLASMLGKPAPVLEVAEVQCHLDDARPPNSLFAGHAPRLRRLCLRNSASFCWSSPILSNLVCLEINGRPGLIERPSRDDVFLALQKMHALEGLSLQNSLPRSPYDSGRVDTLAVAPQRLKLLRIEGTLTDCVAFFTYFQVPEAGVRLDLECTADAEATACSVLLPILAAACGTSAPPFVDLDFEAGSRRTLDVTGEKAPGKERPTPPYFAWGGQVLVRDLELSLAWGRLGRHRACPGALRHAVREAPPQAVCASRRVAPRGASGSPIGWTSSGQRHASRRCARGAQRRCRSVRRCLSFGATGRSGGACWLCPVAARCSFRG